MAAMADQCAACGRHFGGLGPFDKHQRWAGKADAATLTCLDPVTIGMEAQVLGSGTEVWRLPSSEAEMAALERHTAARKAARSRSG